MILSLSNIIIRKYPMTFRKVNNITIPDPWYLDLKAAARDMEDTIKKFNQSNPMQDGELYLLTVVVEDGIMILKMSISKYDVQRERKYGV